MPLEGYPSQCEERQPIIVSRDKGQRREHRALNNDRCLVSHYQIDGVVIKEGKRCDFLLINEDRRIAYLIELKGSCIEDGVEQLAETEKKLSKELSYCQEIKYRLVFSKARTHDLRGCKFKRFQSQHRKQGDFVFSEKSIEEKI